MARKRAVLAALIKRIEVKVDQIALHLRPLRLGALLDLPATPSQGVNDDEIELLSVPARLRRSGREIRMVIYGTDSFAAKPDARLIKLLSERAGSTRHSPRANAFLLLYSPSGKGSAGPISPGSSASAILRRISRRRSSMGGSRPI